LSAEWRHCNPNGRLCNIVKIKTCAMTFQREY
jgi:hypothetical protein